MDSDKTLWTAWGRPVRPGTLFLAIFTAYSAAAAIAARSLLDPTWSDLIGAAGLIAAGALVAGWWATDTAAMALGLLIACGYWAASAADILMVTGNPWSVSAWSAACWGGLAGGLWLRDRRESP